MKVIFLDVDGVLNTSETYEVVAKIFKETGIEELDIDTFRLEYLKKIIEKTNAKIVLSASCRNSFVKENNKIIPISEKGEKIYNLLSSYGIEIYDITPSNYDPKNREITVKEWLSNNDDIDSFIIIDDEPNMFNELLDRLIKTSKVKDDEMLINMDDCVGLCEHHINIAINMLKSKIKVKK